MTLAQRPSACQPGPSTPSARRLALGLVLAVSATSACAQGGARANDAAAADGGPLSPEILREWEQRMVDYGHEVGQSLSATKDPSKRLSDQYYDGQWVFLRIAQYTGQQDPWVQYAKLAERAYKHYLAKNDFNASGYRKFPHGFYVDWKRHGDQESKRYLLELSEEAAYSDPLRDIADGWYEQIRSREVAYSIETQLLAEKAGAQRQDDRMQRFVDMALNHIKIWTTGEYITSDPERQYCQPFMAGLTASALISYYERTVERGDPDERIPAAVQRLADWLWQETWVANVEGSRHGAFQYVQPAVEGVGGNDPAPDLNMLIAPMYGWLYYRTGEPEYRKRGDAVFAGGVALADIGDGKRFNQSYRSSFDYLMWRKAGKRQADNADWFDPAIARIPQRPSS